MNNFDYEKAYFAQALPAFKNLPLPAKEVHAKLIPLIGELNQAKDLNIPMSEAIKELIETLPTIQIAELSRASYFVGHWKPSNTDSPFSNTRGESWKIANCCDQILRKRLELPRNLQIHEGKLRITFSNRDCWLCEEFGLATEENLQTFKTCQLPFGENSLNKSAKKLKSQIGDLWPGIDSVPDNQEYTDYKTAKDNQTNEKLRKSIANLVKEAKDKAEKLIEEAQTKTAAFTWLMDNGYTDLDNVIYYTHKSTFCFGLYKSIKDKEALHNLIAGFPFPYEVK